MDTKYICPAACDGKNRKYLFLKETELQSMTVRLFALTRFKLYVNGQYVCEGPCQNSQYEYCYEQVDITPFLTRPVNELCVEVMHIADFSFIAAYTAEKPLLWLEGQQDGQTVLCSDLSWRALRQTNLEYRPEEYVMNSTGPFEHHSGAPAYEPVELVEGKELAADQPIRNVCGLTYEYPLIRNTLPQMYQGAWQPMKPDKTLENGCVLDAGRYTTAKVRLTLKGTAGDTLKVTYSECYVKNPRGWNSWSVDKGLRDDSTGITIGPSDYITLTGREQTVEFWWYRAFRYITLSCESMAQLDAVVEYAEYFYPYPITAEFTCSDPVYNEIWNTSIRTLLCCSHELVVDCPYFEQQQYGMDSYLEAMYALRLCNDTRMPEKIIRNMAHSQLQDGFLQANYPSRDIQVIPTFSIYWLILLRDYWYYSANAEFVKPYMGTVDKMLSAFENSLDGNGLVLSKYWPYVDWAGDWESGVPKNGFQKPIAVYSMLYSMGLKYARELALAVGRPGLAEDYEARRVRLNRAIKTHFWNPAVRYYNDTLHTEAFSQHTAVWAILAEIETGEAALALFRRMPEISTAVCSFSFGFFLFRVYEKLGIYQEAFPCFEPFRGMLAQHCTTWCENPDSPRSECHGWSATPIYEFSANVLGVQQTGPGWQRVRIAPQCGSLTYAKGRVPTPYGDICVSWELKDGKPELSYTAPAEITVETA